MAGPDIIELFCLDLERLATQYKDDDEFVHDEVAEALGAAARQIRRLHDIAGLYACVHEDIAVAMEKYLKEENHDGA